jgi:hypothetical protein
MASHVANDLKSIFHIISLWHMHLRKEIKMSMGQVGWELQIVNPIMDLGSMLLCTPSDDQLFYFILICSHHSNNSSLFMSILISMRIKFMDMKRHMFNFFPY